MLWHSTLGKRVVAVGTAITLTALGSACSASEQGQEKIDLPKASIITSYSFDAGVTGYFVGVEKGYYKEAGVDLDVQLGTGSNDSLQRLITGSVDFAIADPALVINAMAKDPNLKLVSVANIQQDTMYSVLYIKGRKVSSIEDLPKVKFGDSGGSAATLYPTFVRTALKLDQNTPIKVEQIDPATRIGALIKGTVDAVASVTIEAPQVEALAKASGLEAGFFNFADYGFAPYGYAIVAQRKYIDENPDIVRAVVEGTLRSWQWTAENIDEATKIVMPHFGEVDEDVARQEVRIATDLVTGGAAAKSGIGYADPEKWASTVELAASGFGFDPALIDRDSLFDTSFMPDKPVLPAGK